MSFYPSHKYQGAENTWRRMSKSELSLVKNIISVRCTTFLNGLDNEFNGHVGETNDTLPNDSYDYEDQLCQFSEFEMHAFTKMTGF